LPYIQSSALQDITFLLTFKVEGPQLAPSGMDVSLIGWMKLKSWSFASCVPFCYRLLPGLFKFMATPLSLLSKGCFWSRLRLCC